MVWSSTMLGLSLLHSHPTHSFVSHTDLSAGLCIPQRALVPKPLSVLFPVLGMLFLKHTCFASLVECYLLEGLSAESCFKLQFLLVSNLLLCFIFLHSTCYYLQLFFYFVYSDSFHCAFPPFFRAVVFA